MYILTAMYFSEQQLNNITLTGVISRWLFFHQIQTKIVDKVIIKWYRRADSLMYNVCSICNTMLPYSEYLNFIIYWEDNLQWIVHPNLEKQLKLKSLKE